MGEECFVPILILSNPASLKSECSSIGDEFVWIPGELDGVPHLRSPLMVKPGRPALHRLPWSHRPHIRVSRSWKLPGGCPSTEP